MRKNLFILWLVFLLLPLAVHAEENSSAPKAKPSLMELLDNDDLEITPLRSAEDSISHTSSGLEEYWIRLFKLYRHIDRTFPGDAIDGDLKEEIHKLLPNLTTQELYDQEEYMRFVIKNYRGIRDLINKFKSQALLPEDPPLIVDLKELEPYNDPYIESENELIVIYDPKKVIPYASDKKNFRALRASLDYAKPKSNTQLRFEELQNQLGKLDIRKIPFYNSIYDDPFSGRKGVGKWVEQPNLQARIISAKTAIGDGKQIKAALALSPENGFIIPDKGSKTFKIDFDKLMAVRPQELQLGILKRLRGAPIDRHTIDCQMIYSKYPPYEIMQTKDMSYTELQEIKRIARYLDIFYNSGNFPTSAELLLKAQSSPFEVMADFSRFIWNNYQQTHKISIGRQSQMLFEYLQKYYLRAQVAEALLEDYERKGRKDNVFYLREVLKCKKD